MPASAGNDRHIHHSTLAPEEFDIQPLSPIRFRFDASRRLHGSRAFDSVFAAKARRRLGPITVCGKPNGLPHCRLGLSVSRKVGSAVVRNRLKRLFREAFRLSQHDLPAGYDLVVVAHPHEIGRAHV